VTRGALSRTRQDTRVGVGRSSRGKRHDNMHRSVRIVFRSACLGEDRCPDRDAENSQDDATHVLLRTRAEVAPEHPCSLTLIVAAKLQRRATPKIARTGFYRGETGTSTAFERRAMHKPARYFHHRLPVDASRRPDTPHSRLYRPA
jgi:hypothetical protein